ncbi:iron-siderophore ABC transporter substrate-binding protein [Halomonas saccharevitans]|uniref:Iron-siderophore ABC transporter substrate-binding protein n=1 Tax=Halomonas saccharevitans TaxID=416872 RepID=A0ABU3NH13_9GAMM|nr:iron-siderophore ABC transporter substrate-binding protein [Halomonas saccharevitans]MDT8880458.1 iron-siderophore ABC transporter substrate-binding protein [Halomonas saccharevitans]
MPRPRRALTWLAGLTAALVAAATPADAPRLATLDWTLAETLVALGAPPAAVAQVEAYHAWVGEPALPASTIDLGLRSQPNLERLASLAPERILISPMFANLTPRLEHIAPVETLPLYRPERDTWREMRELTRSIGEMAERPEAASGLIEQTEARLDALRQRLDDATAPLLIMQFMDSRHVRVFGDNGLYQAVLDRLGIDNAWTGPTNAWGFSLVGLEALAGLDARLVVVEPYPAGVRERLDDGGLWGHLVEASRGTPIVLPPIWSFGALPSAERFAEQLVNALEPDDAA